MTQIISLAAASLGDTLPPIELPNSGKFTQSLTVPLRKPRRDTAEGCRDRATSSRQHAGTMASDNDRKLLEDSAESWSARADLLQRLETINEALLDLPITPVITDHEPSEVPSIPAAPQP